MSATRGAIEREAQTGRWIEDWNPEDKGFWETKGKYVARRNLVFSVFAEFLGFAVWQLFSIVAALLPLIGYDFTAAQLLVPFLVAASAIVIIGGSRTNSATGSEVFVQNAAFFWVPLVVISALCAYFFMDNLRVAQATPREQAPVVRRKHTWVMSYLYIGTFGSFIGYSASFPVLIGNVFPEYAATWLAALGPIIGSLARPPGGRLSDKVGGARVTLWTFVLMALGVVSALYFLSVGSFGGFFVSFMFLFAMAGVGNGSTYRTIPAIFRIERERISDGEGEGVLAEARRRGLKEGSFVLGFVGAIGAYGGFIIPRAFAGSVEATGGPQVALAAFVVFYVTCIAVTWFFYARRGAEIRC